MLKTLGIHFIRHPCLTRTVRVRPPAAPKNSTPLASGRKCGGAGCRIAVVWVGASLRRLCATAIVHPCTTRTVRASPPSTKKAGLCLFVITKCSGAGCRNAVVWVAASCSDFVRPLSCIHCTTRTVRVRPPAPKKQDYACLGIALLFWCRWRGSNPHGIATNGF